MLQHAAVPCRTATAALPGGSVRDVSLTIAEARREHDEGLPADTIPHLVAAYGSRYRDVLELAGNRAEWRTRIAPDSPVVGAELVWAARHEMAITLADAVMYSIDYPHSVSLWPNSRSYTERLTAGMDASTRTKVLAGNAARVYRLG